MFTHVVYISICDKKKVIAGVEQFRGSIVIVKYCGTFKVETTINETKDTIYDYRKREKVRENHGRPRRSRGWQQYLRGNNFQCYPRMRAIFIRLYWLFVEYIVYITSCSCENLRLHFVFRHPFPSGVITKQRNYIFFNLLLQNISAILIQTYYKAPLCERDSSFYN